MTLPKPRADLKPNTADFERLPLVKPTGFREYDARWLYPQEINLMGLNSMGLGLATLFARAGVPKRFVVGHDFRSYSGSVKQALITGLLSGGAEVHDIGLALSPMALTLPMMACWLAGESSSLTRSETCWTCSRMNEPWSANLLSRPGRRGMRVGSSSSVVRAMSESPSLSSCTKASPVTPW